MNRTGPGTASWTMLKFQVMLGYAQNNFINIKKTKNQMKSFGPTMVGNFPPEIPVGGSYPQITAIRFKETG